MVLRSEERWLYISTKQGEILIYEIPAITPVMLSSISLPTSHAESLIYDGNSNLLFALCSDSILWTYQIDPTNSDVPHIHLTSFKVPNQPSWDWMGWKYNSFCFGTPTSISIADTESEGRCRYAINQSGQWVQFHEKSISTVRCMSSHELLISGSKDGSMIIWWLPTAWRDWDVAEFE